jgi:digeranylgeranylglycerophospholipid reductase
LNVTLYEKGIIGENIKCAEGFFDTLNLLGKPEYGVKYKVENFILQLRSGYTFPCDDKINIWMLDKGQWLRGLADEARELGVNIIENFRIDKNNLSKITAENDWVIDGTGAPSVTSLAYGFSKFYTGTSGITAQYRLEGDFKALYRNFKLGFQEHYSGYYWIFPRSESEANVGIGILAGDRPNLWVELDKILEKEKLSSYKITKKLGGLCPFKRPCRLVYDNIILTGDGAGLASPLHGGGIDTACLSGKIAVKSIAENRVGLYESSINKALGKKLSGDKRLFDIYNSLSYDSFEKIIRKLNGANVELGNSGCFNGEFNLLKSAKYLKDIVLPVKNR